MTQAKLLLRRGAPYPDESFSGYIVRLTEKNYYGSAQWIWTLAGLTKSIRYANRLSREEHSLSGLSQITGVDEDALWATTFPKVKTDSKKIHVQIFNSTLPFYYLTKRTLRVCPRCLVDSAYCRKIWDLSVVTVCPIHKCLLIDTCPNCDKEITWSRASVTQCKQCKYDWRSSRPILVTDDEVALSWHIYKLCGLYVPEKLNTELVEAINPATSLGLRDLVVLIHFLSQYFAKDYAVDYFQFSFLVRSNIFHSLSTRAFLLFRDWPLNFYTFTNWLGNELGEKPGWYTKFIPDRENTYFTHLLKSFNSHKEFSNDAFSFFREACEESGVSYTSRTLAGKSLPWMGNYSQAYMRHVTRLEAAYLLKVEETRILELIQEGELETENLTHWISQTIIKSKSLREYKRKIKNK